MPIAGPSMISLLNQAIYEKNSLITGGYRRFCSMQESCLGQFPETRCTKPPVSLSPLSVVSDMTP